MEFCRPIKLHVHLLPKCSPKYTKNSCVLIQNDYPQYPKVHPYLSKEKVQCVFPTNDIFIGYLNTHVSKPVKYDK